MITIPGKPIGKERPRLWLRGRTATIYTPPKTRMYEELVAWCARSAKVQPANGALRVEMRIYVSRKAKRRSDIDNIQKSTFDGLNGIAYHDDSQIEDVHAVFVPVDHETEERVEVEIFEMEAG